MTDTTLSLAQTNRLDQIDDENPEAKVVGWDEQGHGPTVLYGDGKRRVVNPHGRLLPRRSAPTGIRGGSWKERLAA